MRRSRVRTVRWHNGENPKVYRVSKRIDNQWLGWVEVFEEGARALDNDKKEVGWFRNSHQAALELLSESLPLSSTSSQSSSELGGRLNPEAETEPNLGLGCL